MLVGNYGSNNIESGSHLVSLRRAKAELRSPVMLTEDCIID